MPRYTAADYGEMVRLYAQERSLIRAGAAFGCSHNTIRAALRRVSVRVRPSGGRRKPPGSAPTWFRRRSTNGYATWFGWIPGENRYATIAEHRLTVERALGRPLLRSEEVHHRNGVRDDNRLEISSYASGLTDLERLTVRIAEKFSARFLLLSRVVDRRRRSETSTRDKQRVPPSRRE